jgi:hypothetical protein
MQRLMSHCGGCTCRAQEHTILPNETVYTRVIFPLPRDKDYYVVGILADIVNKIHVHHFVVTVSSTALVLQTA